MNRVEEKHPKNSFGYTPFHKAAKNGHQQVVSFLSKCLTPNDDMQNIWGETPLSYLP
jgi:ankyrin repeat protein